MHGIPTNYYHHNRKTHMQILTLEKSKPLLNNKRRHLSPQRARRQILPAFTCTWVLTRTEDMKANAIKSAARKVMYPQLVSGQQRVFA
jgi:hypothetical protein